MKAIEKLIGERLRKECDKLAKNLKKEWGMTRIGQAKRQVNKKKRG